MVGIKCENSGLPYKLSGLFLEEHADRLNEEVEKRGKDSEAIQHIEVALLLPSWMHNQWLSKKNGEENLSL